MNNRKQAIINSGKTDFFKKAEWQKLRYRVIKKYNGKCCCCGRSQADHGVIIHVDHVEPRSWKPELELDEDNLQTLCEDCNLGKGNLDNSDFRNEKPVVSDEHKICLICNYWHPLSRLNSSQLCAECSGLNETYSEEIAELKEAITGGMFVQNRADVKVVGITFEVNEFSYSVRYPDGQIVKTAIACDEYKSIDEETYRKKALRYKVLSKVSKCKHEKLMMLDDML